MTMSNNAPPSGAFDFNTFLRQNNIPPPAVSSSSTSNEPTNSSETQMKAVPPNYSGTSLPHTAAAASDVVLSYDATLQEGDVQQPTATLPIAHYPSVPPEFPYSGSTIAVNAQYICYVTKNGLIRVIDRRNAARMLLRGHGGFASSKGQIVYDLQFFSDTSDVLASVGTFGDDEFIADNGGEDGSKATDDDAAAAASINSGVIVWRIFNDNGVQSEKLLQIRYPACRVTWHPFTPNMFLLIRHSNSDAFAKVDGIRQSCVHEAVHIETTRLLTSSHLKEGHAVCDSYDKLLDGNGASEEDPVQPSFGARMRGHTAALIDVDWSKDATKSITCAADGSVKIWDLTVANHNIGTDGMALVSCLATIEIESSAKENESAKRVFFLPKYTGSGVAFMTTSANNTRAMLWTLDGSNVTQKLQEFQFYQSIERPRRFITTLCTCSSSSFLMFGDMDEGNLYAIHLSTSENRFDFLVPFRVLHPFYSWCPLVSATDINDLDVGEQSLNSIEDESEVSLFSVQDKAVQHVKLKVGSCLPYFASSVPVAKSVLIKDGIEGSKGNVIEEDDVEEYDLDDESTDDEYEGNDAADIPIEDTNKDMSKTLPPVDNDSVQDDSGGFSNWLGSIISGSQGDTSIAQEPKNVEASTGSKELTRIPTPSPPPMPVTAKSPGHLLSPKELLKKVEKTPSKTTSQLTQGDESKSISKNENHKRANVSKKQPKSRENTPPPPPSGKISILKREDKNLSAQLNSSEPSSSKASISEADLEKVTRAVSKSVASSSKKRDAVLLGEIQKTIKEEMQETVIPALGKVVSQSIENSVSKPLRLALTKHAKESSHIRTKEVIDAISDSVKAPVTDAFEETMRQVIVPAYEIATNEMFSQVAKSVESALPPQENGEYLQLMSEMSDMIKVMSNTIDNLTREVSELRITVNSQQSNTHIVNQEPMSEMDKLKKTISNELEVGNYEVAFTTALSASSADLTVFACENADISLVLDEENLLVSQAILLCLMQQLSASLAEPNNADPKVELEWLQEITVVLNPNDANISAHAGNVLRQAGQNISAKAAMGDLSRAQKRQLQTLLQVFRGLASG